MMQVILICFALCFFFDTRYRSDDLKTVANTSHGIVFVISVACGACVLSNLSTTCFPSTEVAVQQSAPLRHLVCVLAHIACTYVLFESAFGRVTKWKKYIDDEHAMINKTM